MNHPGFVRNGVYCKSGGEGQRVILTREKEGPSDWSTPSLSSCYTALAESKNGFICINVAENKYDTFSMKIMKGSGAQQYSTYADCKYRLGTAIDGKICRRYDDDKIRIFHEDGKINKEQTFSTINSCVDFIHNSKSL